MNLTDFITTTFTNPNSTKRTKILNECILDEFKKDNPQYAMLNWKYERKLRDSYNLKNKDENGNWDGTWSFHKKYGFFQVDIAGFDDNNIPKIVILNKSLNNNILQNIFNYPNTTLGEADRLLLGPHRNDIEQLFFVTIYPNKTPYFYEGGKIKRIENVVERMKWADASEMLYEKYGDKIKLVVYTYDINDLSQYTHKSQFQQGITISNLQKYESDFSRRLYSDYVHTS
jgi:hypothetical protein